MHRFIVVRAFGRSDRFAVIRLDVGWLPVALHGPFNEDTTRSYLSEEGLSDHQIDADVARVKGQPAT